MVTIKDSRKKRRNVQKIANVPWLKEGKDYLESDANAQGIHIAISSGVMVGPASGAKHSWIKSIVKHFESFGMSQCDKE